MNNGIYQINSEPSNKTVWYSSVISSVHQRTVTNKTLNRCASKLRLTTITGITVVEFIKRSQLYIPPADDDKIYYVDASKKYRPDLLALEIYGTPTLYWVILSCNNLKHPLELEAGLTIRIPNISRIIHDRRIT